MKCYKCQFENPNESSYCMNCGARLDGKIMCPTCRTLVEKDETKCPKCGSTNLGILSYDEKKLFSTNYAIFCKNDNCFCTGAIRRRMKDAIIAWNERIAQFVDREDYNY